MAEPERSSALRRRLVAAFMSVALISLAVLFIGTVVPHLPDRHVDPHDPVSLVWLLVATALAAVTAIGLSFVIADRLTRPVDGYIETARRFAAGDHSARPVDLGPPEFAELATALVAAADEIERSETARRQLTDDIAHELRTPLAALQAGLEELRDGLVPADPEALFALHNQATRLGRIVNDLSDLAAAESSELHVTLDEVDLAAVAELALPAHASSMKSAGLLVVQDLQPGTRVIADAGRMHINWLDMGFPATDLAAFSGQQRVTPFNHGDIGGCPADIDYQAVAIVLRSAERGGAGRAAGHGQRRLVDGFPGLHGLAVAADDH